MDLVLNSLAGPIQQASVRCVAQHGRFLEIGKYDITVDSQLGMASLGKNISFHAIFLDQVMQDVPNIHPDWPVVKQLMEDVRLFFDLTVTSIIQAVFYTTQQLVCHSYGTVFIKRKGYFFYFGIKSTGFEAITG